MILVEAAAGSSRRGGGGFGWHRKSARLKEHVSSGTQPRPGVEPGDPQHEAEGWTQCLQGRGDYASDAECSP